MDVFDKIFQNDSLTIIFKDKTIGCGELKKKVLAAAYYLIEKNIKENERVVILGNNSSDFVILILALWKIGAVPVPLNSNFTAIELQNLIELITPKTVLIDKTLNKTPQIENQSRIDYPFEFSEVGSTQIFKPFSNLDRTALIIFTSGSSGKPKGAKLSFNNLIKSAEAQNNFLELGQEDKYLASLPFYHIGGFSIITRTLLSGGVIIIPDSFKIETTIDEITKYQPKSVSLVPTQLKRMIERDFMPPNSLKNVLLGGSYLDNKLISEAIKNGWKIIKVYGSTETCSFITAKIINSEKDISNSLGKVIGKNEIKIMYGRIAVKGESIMQGYLNQPANFTDEGFFITEDYGRINTNYELLIDGRREDIIISGGKNISVTEIENIIIEFDKIEDAVVIGLKDDEWTEIVAVVAVPFENEIFPLADLNNFLSKKIAGFKLPKKLFFVDEIPRNEMGKVMRRELLKIINR